MAKVGSIVSAVNLTWTKTFNENDTKKIEDENSRQSGRTRLGSYFFRSKTPETQPIRQIGKTIPPMDFQTSLRHKTPIVTIHGIKGSVLADSNGNICWLTGSQAAGLTTPDLSLPITWSGGLQDTDDISPLHTLKAITLIPYLFKADMYDKWLRKAQTLGCSAYEFPYDWRRSPLETTTKFLKYLQWISAKHNGEKIQVVAHSMGSLITLAALHICPEVFHSVLFAAAPFKGGPGFFPDLHVGVPQGRNYKIISPNVAFTFPSFFSVFPLPGEHPEPYSGVIDTNGNIVTIDWFDISIWKELKLSIYSDEYLPTELEENHLKNCLGDAKKFRELLLAKDMSYPPILVISSDKIPTSKWCIKGGPNGYDFVSSPKVPGDGRVPFDFSQPTGIPHQIYKSLFNHEGILNDEKIPNLLSEMVMQTYQMSLNSKL